MPSYPGRLYHRTPAWVESGATYHIRISVDRGYALRLIDPGIGTALLDSVRFYHEHCRWNCRLFLLMPDHIHALLTFPYREDMGVIVAAWKGYQTKQLGLRWQGNYFDHRIRDRHELEKKAAYIRLNPVRKNLCPQEEAWPWVLSGDAEKPVRRPGSTSKQNARPYGRALKADRIGTLTWSGRSGSS